MRIFTAFYMCFLFSFCNLLNAQFSFKRNIHNESGNTRFYNMAITEKDNSIIGTTSPDAVPWGGLYLSKLDRKGKLLWAKNYAYSLPYPWAFNEIKIIPTENDGFVAIGALQQSFGGFGSVVFKADSNGNIIWAKRLKPDLKKYTTISLGCAYANDKSIYTIHTIIDSGLVIERLNAKGEFIWNRYLPTLDNRNISTYFTFAVTTPDNGLVISISFTNRSKGETHDHLLKISKNGDAEWEYTTKETSDYYNNNVAQSNNNGKLNILYYRYGHYDYSVLDPASGESHTYDIGKTVFDIQSFLRKNNSNIFKGVTFPYLGNEQTINGFVDNQSFLETSQIQKGLTDYTTRIELYDSIGRICPDYTIPVTRSNRNEIDFKFIKSSFQFSASPITFSSIDTVLTITDFDTITNVCAGKPSSLIKSENKNNVTTSTIDAVRIFPNPVKGQLAFSANTNTRSSLKIEIISVDGKVIKSKTQTGLKIQNNYYVNVEDITPGIYYLKIILPGSVVTKTFLKQ